MASDDSNTKKRKPQKRETAESMAQKQREISVSEFFLKNRHLLGFDSPRKALLTAVKEAVDNALDACEEAGILPEISVDIRQTGASRFLINVTDNGPGIVKAQIPKIFGKLLYGSKFHRLRMSRGQQGIGISAAGMYGQLTTGNSTVVLSKTRNQKNAHRMEVQLDTASNKPNILKEEEIEWLPQFYPAPEDGKEAAPLISHHGTSVAIEMEAAYVRGRLSVDEYVKQCAIVNPHLAIHYRIDLLKPAAEQTENKTEPWITFHRVVKTVPDAPQEIKPHPHGVELGMLMKMLKDSGARNVSSALAHDFSRISSKTAQEICELAGINPKARPAAIAHRESEALYKAIQETKLMRPPTDCLSPIGEEQLIAGLKKEIVADFYTSITRKPSVYRGNPFQVEVAMAYAKPGTNEDLGAEDPIRLMRFANRVPLLYMAGACAITRAVSSVNWRAYGLNQPRGNLPIGPLAVSVHIASVWVPFTSESKEAIAHYPEIVKEITFGLQECGRRLSVFLSHKRKLAEAERKRNYMEQYIPHLALGLKNVLNLNDKQEKQVVTSLKNLLERTHLQI
ncbi:MAG: DNA topoisomerase VI subunit B [Kiritimatiellia bacterium]